MQRAHLHDKFEQFGQFGQFGLEALVPTKRPLDRIGVECAHLRDEIRKLRVRVLDSRSGQWVLSSGLGRDGRAT